VGKSGVALTLLRPAGIAEIDGKRVDVMTAGEFLAKGCRVTVVKAEGMHILVREADAE
jgi:membrane-bound serine protease (ClpP class)